VPLQVDASMLNPSMIKPGTHALIRTDEWFYGADGRTYTAAYGPVFVIKAEDALGFKPKNSADWFLQVGDAESGEAVLIAGCRIHYVGLFPVCPNGADIYDATPSEAS
jgi:hypothetical protein